jgi:hypothetical protein
MFSRQAAVMLAEQRQQNRLAVEATASIATTSAAVAWPHSLSQACHRMSGLDGIRLGTQRPEAGTSAQSFAAFDNRVTVFQRALFPSCNIQNMEWRVQF